MKKISALIFAMLLLVSLMVGCTGNTGDPGNTGNTANTENTSSGNNNNTAKMSRGVWQDNLFTSEYTGLKYKLPSGWNIGTDEEIAEMMSVSLSVMTEAGMPFTQEMLNLTTIYDMVVQDPSTGASVMILYENLAMSIGGTKCTEDDYLDIIQKQFEEVGLGYTFGSKGTQTISGSTYKGIDASVTMYGVEMEQSYYVRKLDKYMIAIIVTSTSLSDDVPTLLKSFQ